MSFRNVGAVAKKEAVCQESQTAAEVKRNVCRYRREEPSGMRMPAIKPTRPREATLMKPRALEGRFLGGADLMGIEASPASGSILAEE